MRREPMNPQLQRQTLMYLLIAQALVMAPLFLHLPAWLGLVWLVAVVIRWQVYRGVWRFPGNIGKGILGVASITGLALEYGVSMGVEPMVGLLLIAFMLKLVEVRQRRDLLLMVFIGFIAVAAQFLFWQNIPVTLYGLICCVALLVAWHSCYSTHPLRLNAYLKSNGKLLLQALPLMILLFLVLPRLGPLWSVASTKSAGTTGFSDSMAPGDIAQLSLSSKVAFRVTFDDTEPTKPQMYWRGLVLDQFDGRRWSSSETSGANDKWRYDRETPVQTWEMPARDQLLTYRIMLEPHQERWLFALETPLAIDTAFPTAFTDNHLLKARWPVRNRVQYQMTSQLNTVRDLSGLSEQVRARNLALPESPPNPRAQRLAASWRDLPPHRILDSALQIYQRQFRYTLQPPPLGANSIDEFLFITRQGFCEHFAGSFVYLMRAAGVPARVVVGYQGGERSQVDDYWLVRQSSAHVWAEVWLAGEGWVRVDPTGVVAPNRIELGLDGALGADEIYLAGGENLLSSQHWRWLGKFQHRWDAMSYAWHQAVVSYDSASQRSLFKRLLGGEDFWRVAIALICGGGGLLGLYGLVSWYGRRPARAPLETRLLRQAERRLGVSRHSAESPHQWAGRVATLNPQCGHSVLRVARLFEAVVYAGRRDLLHKLQQAVETLPKRG